MNKPTLKRDRYQSGSLKIEKRNTGIDVWVYRWREYRHDGASTYRKKIIGPVRELRTKAAAQKAVEGLKLDINALVSAVPVSHAVAELIAHFKGTELVSEKHTARTLSVYLYHLDKVLLPRWGSYRLQDVSACRSGTMVSNLAVCTSHQKQGEDGTRYGVPSWDAVSVGVNQPHCACTVQWQAGTDTGHPYAGRDSRHSWRAS